MSGRVVISGRLVCKTAEEAALVAAHAPEHVRLTRAEPGCNGFDISATADPLVWVVAEEFADEAAFARHRDRTRASGWWAATAHVERRWD